MPAFRCPLCGYEGSDGPAASDFAGPCPRCGEMFGPQAVKPVNVEGRTLLAGSALTIVAMLTLLVSLGWIVVNFAAAPPLPQPAPGQDPTAAVAARFGMLVGQILPPGVGLMLGLLGLIGGIQMLRRRMWGLAVTGAFVMALPCTCGFPLGPPVGIWALLVLANPAVRASFR